MAMALSLLWREMTFQKNTLETLIVTEHKCNYMVLPVRTNTRPCYIAATAAGEAEQTQPGRLGLNQRLQSSCCHPGFSSTPDEWVQVFWYSTDVPALTFKLDLFIAQSRRVQGKEVLKRISRSPTESPE